MKIFVCGTSEQLGAAAAKKAAETLLQAVAEKGSARLVLSTGASQLDTLEALIHEKVDWSRVDMFHLDEYVGLPDTHQASFRKYLRERFIQKVPLKSACLVDGSPDSIGRITESLRAAPIDLGLIGIGENAHIAFNDPPADFDTRDAYITVHLNDACKAQQVREGWFSSVDEVPSQAISMTVWQILQCKTVLSCVPFRVKAQAIRDTLYSDVITNEIPATALKKHPAFSLYLDQDSASLIDPALIVPDKDDKDYTFCKSDI